MAVQGRRLGLQSLKLFYEVISEAEERVLLQWVDPLMKRRRYEGSHWDDVISRYKEVDTTNYKRSEEVGAVLTKVETFVRAHMLKPHAESDKFISPHLIDLAPDGYIGAHVDSIKFSGDLVAGLSLNSTRAMVLTPDVDADPVMLGNAALAERELLGLDSADPVVVRVDRPGTGLPAKVTMVLPRRSLYLMQGIWRYQYGHAVSLPVVDGAVVESTAANAQTFSASEQRRVSIIFRNSWSALDQGRRL